MLHPHAPPSGSSIRRPHLFYDDPTDGNDQANERWEKLLDQNGLSMENVLNDILAG